MLCVACSVYSATIISTVVLYMQVPHVVLQASRNSKSMSINYEYMVRCILDQVGIKSASENGGRTQFLCKRWMAEDNVLQVRDPYEINRLPQRQYPTPQNEYEVKVLPKSGFLIVLLRPPGLCYEIDHDGSVVRNSKGKPKMKPMVRLLFRMKDLYLLGYLWGDKWWVFSDVILKDHVSDVNIKRFFMRLPYESNYGGSGLRVNFDRVRIGSPELCFTYNVLSDSGRYTQEQVMQALTVVAVTCSEGTRRRFMYGRLISIFSRGESEFVDTSTQLASKKFRAWSKDSRCVRDSLKLNAGLDASARTLMRDLMVVPSTGEQEGA